uniref:Uncharacterized protein n=1 Tax=Cacopsylla melanoneura TaxID=428564 RepID=A0A8D8ZTQ6_9HEMI
MFNLRLMYIMLSMSMSMVWCNHKKHCSGVNPLSMPSQPFAGRFYLYASTSCYDSTSTKYRYGLFNNKGSKCEVIDFYSNGRSYEQNKATHFIDYAYNENTKDCDVTVFDYYTLNSTYSESNLGVYVAESKGYYDDKKMHGGSSSSSSSSEEKKAVSQGKHRFFFTCLANQADYKVFYVCTKFNHLSQNKPVVWILTSSAKPSPATIESIKSCLSSNNVNIYDSLTFIDHSSSCNYKKPQDSYGGYSYSG